MDDKLVSIEGLGEKFDSQADLQKYCDAQYQVITNLKKENKVLRAELEHLKDLLSAATELTSIAAPTIKVEISPAQVICEMQILKIYDDAAVRQLTLEETKRLEILIKSLNLLKKEGEGAITPEFAKLPPGVNLLNLAKMASLPDKKPEAGESE